MNIGIIGLGARSQAYVINIPKFFSQHKIISVCEKDAERLENYTEYYFKDNMPDKYTDFNEMLKDERLDACTWYAMREVFALSQRIPADQVDMKALFPEDRDFSDVFAQHEIPKHSSREVASAMREAREAKAAKAAAREAAKEAGEGADKEVAAEA